jgi:CheY-like chemotaxis protein
MKHHVLVIEDHAEIAQMIHSLLEIEGYSVSLARNGCEGLALLARKTPCLILLDIIMPGMDGFAFLDILRLKEPAGPVPVLVMTADMHAASMFELQQVPVVRKPFKFAPLLALIKDSCQN